MPSIKQTYNTEETLTITLASLANNTGRASTAINNTSLRAISTDIRVRIRTGASGVSSTGYVSVWLLRSFDGSVYDDGFAGTDGAWTPKNAEIIGYIEANANATTYDKFFSLSKLGIELSPYFAIGIYNATGAALDST
ncbi:MAG: hypothetical protein N3D20_03375, partial [Candidatus Pacearchaeota archaeon]|nr:hypothetical protein [Candidatus Pacearchaeota archaeon]